MGKRPNQYTNFAGRYESGASLDPEFQVQIVFLGAFKSLLKPADMPQRLSAKQGRSRLGRA
jgi:hypothetical protein